jgi:hypothetical protein
VKNINNIEEARHIQGEPHKQLANLASLRANNFLNPLFPGHYSPLQKQSLIHKLLASNNDNQESHAIPSVPETTENTPVNSTK